VARKSAVKLVESVKYTPTKLDIGCGKNPREGFTGMDVIDFGQEIVHDARAAWPFENDSIEEINCSHFIEHLTAPERIHFVNEAYRVMKMGGKMTIVVPHYASERAYGDLTHQWPPVVGFWFSYLDKLWRSVQAPHNTEYTCDFHATWGFSLHPQIQSRNQEYQMHALTFWREAAQDMIATLTKK